MSDGAGDGHQYECDTCGARFCGHLAHDVAELAITRARAEAAEAQVAALRGQEVAALQTQPPAPATVAGLTADDLRWAAVMARGQADGLETRYRSGHRFANKKETVIAWKERAERFEAAALGEGEQP